MKYALTTMAFALALGSCTFENEEDRYGTGDPCETAAVSYSQDVALILSTNCTSCHNDISPTAGLSLEGHTNASTSALGGGLMNRVQRPSGDPLLMPPSGQLSECDQAKLRKWVNEGALDN
ncbi:MAG: Uncharacterised protein [Cryomorphaceae bacterium]|nr:MAG: Uncharacterised protein [Cryomorphaceae bacterium]